MKNTLFHFLILFVALLVAQVICSKIILFGVAMPVIYIYLILRLPMNYSLNWTLTIAFLFGLFIDMFNNTQGMNALACTVMTMSRRPVFNLFILKDDEDNDPIPSMDSLGITDYLKYMATLVTIYCTVLFLTQAFTLHNIGLTLMRIIASSVLSILLIFGIDSLVSTEREKRL
ncbi:MAG: rod shape-determining protein MreD [Muribaculaceae bacterium]|nr:rod shape-determining protein MreD [Muribaculaceae bacterium]